MSTTEAYEAEIARYLEGFGANIRRLRTAGDPGYSQEWLAGTTGLHRTEIGRLEQGKVEPRLTTLVILAESTAHVMSVADLGTRVPSGRDSKGVPSRIA